MKKPLLGTGIFNPADLSVQDLTPKSGEVSGKFAGEPLGIRE